MRFSVNLIPTAQRASPTRLWTEAIATNGQPLESGWPYLADLQPHDPWTLPAIPVTVYRRNTKTIGKALKDIYDALGTGTPVVVVMED